MWYGVWSMEYGGATIERTCQCAHVDRYIPTECLHRPITRANGPLHASPGPTARYKLAQAGASVLASAGLGSRSRQFR
jgi:hypothetical protein